MGLMPPSAAVLHVFGVADPVALTGGTGTSWRAGALVLKPVGEILEPLEWLESLPQTRTIRTARPVRAADGRIVVDGWSVTPFLVGGRVKNAWQHIAAAGRALSDELAGATSPEWIGRRDDPWAVADRVAWGEEDVPAATPGWLRALADRRSLIDSSSMLIHGDLTGNTLFQPGLPPAVIDFSPYCRPVEYAVAIVAVDAVCFEGAPRSAGELVRGVDARQLLLRAILFRAFTDVLHGGMPAEETYTPAAALLR